MNNELKATGKRFLAKEVDRKLRRGTPNPFGKKLQVLEYVVTQAGELDLQAGDTVFVLPNTGVAVKNLPENMQLFSFHIDSIMAHLPVQTNTVIDAPHVPHVTEED